MKKVFSTLRERFCSKTVEELEEEIDNPELRERLDTAGLESLTEDYWFRWLIKTFPDEAEKLDEIRSRLLER